MGILETFISPATGWACHIWARDVVAVINNVKKLITNDTNLEEMNIWFPNISAPTYLINNKFIQMAKYTINELTIHITEMPYGLWSGPWAESFIDDPIVDSIIDNSTDLEIDIKIILKHTAFDVINKLPKDNLMDNVIKYFKLYIRDYDSINMIDHNGLIKECGSDYTIPLMEWYNMRKKLYAIRIDRRTIQLKWLIIMYENIIRYSDIYYEYKLAGKTKEYCVNKLTEMNYTMLNKSHIQNPEFTELSNLEEYFTINASYDYLLSMSDLNRLKEPNDNRRIKLKEYIDELKELTIEDVYFKGSSIWLKEIEEAEKIIYHGININWNYNDSQEYN
jgi:hypothetical protein